MSRWRGGTAMVVYGTMGAADWIGLAGAAIYCVGYGATALDRLPSHSPWFYVVKLIAAALVLVSLTSAMNLAAAVIQVFFAAVSVLGLLRHAGRIGLRAPRPRGAASAGLAPVSPGRPTGSP